MTAAVRYKAFIYEQCVKRLRLVFVVCPVLLALVGPLSVAFQAIQRVEPVAPCR